MDELDMVMSLPEEIRIKIFNMIYQDEILNARLVCKAWNEQIQGSYEYFVDVCEDSSDFDTKRQLRIKQMIIEKLVTTPVMNPDGTSIFSHPYAVKRLFMGSNWGKVAQLNLQLTLGLFEENLVQLYLNINSEICNFEFSPSLSFNFKKLKTLFITSDESDNDCQDNPRSLLQVLENSSFPRLEAVKFDLELLKLQGTPLFRIIANVLRMLSKHGKFLKHLYISTLELRELTEIPDSVQQQELLRIKQIKTLERVYVFIPPISSRMNRLWNEIVARQKVLKMVILECHLPIFSSSLIRQIVLNNSTTLEHLQITGFSISHTDPPFDLSIFQNCMKLKRLQLEESENYEVIIMRPNPEEPDVINFHLLPQNLKILIFKKFKILSEEVLIAFQSNNPLNKTNGFQKLEVLRLTACGREGVFGINSACLQSLMQTNRPNLINMDFRFGGIHERDEYMEAVLAQFGLSDDQVFAILWDFDNFTWRYYF